jgi:hypothetical protein
MKLKFALLLVTVLTITIAMSTDFTAASSTAPQEKVQVCHKSGNGSFHLISISINAESAHVAHGDGQPGDPVPNMAGFIFGDNCTPTTAPPADLATGCYKFDNNFDTVDLRYIGPIDTLGNLVLFFNSSNGTCSGLGLPDLTSGIIAAANETDAQTKCNTLQGNQAGAFVIDLGAPTAFVPSAPGFWFCSIVGF